MHSVPGQDLVITSSSLAMHGPHFLTVWDLPTEEERFSEKQFLPALTSREETPTAQVIRYSFKMSPSLFLYAEWTVIGTGAY